MKKVCMMFVIASIWLLAMEPIVNALWLKEHQNDKDLIIIDVSDDTLFAKGHIPKSVNSPISQWRKKQENYLLVKDAEAIQKEFVSLGINQNSKVVLYSHHEDAKDTLKASYVIWAMEYYGFDNTAMLDGGFVGWKEHNGSLSTDVITLPKGDFKVVKNEALIADIELVKAQVGRTKMVDARPPEYYFGVQKQPDLKYAGHIPKAKSYFWKYSFEGEYLKNRETLKEMLVKGMGFDPQKPIITYCTGGLETSMNFFVLHRLLGFDTIRLYDASMKEWANKDYTPMTKHNWE